jgi:hypothetical protein
MNPGLCILQGLSFAIAPLRARRSPPLAPTLHPTVTREIPMKRKAKRRRTPSTAILESAADSAELLREAEARHGTSPALAGGDVTRIGPARRARAKRRWGEPSPCRTRTWWTRSAGRSAWSRHPTPRCAPRKSFCTTAISAAENSSVTPRKAARSLGEVSLQASLECTPLGLRSAGGCQGARAREGAQRGWPATSSKLRHAAPEPDHEGDTR